MRTGRPKKYSMEIIDYALRSTTKKPKEIRKIIYEKYGINIHRNVLLYWKNHFRYSGSDKTIKELKEAVKLRNKEARETEDKALKLRYEAKAIRRAIIEKRYENTPRKM